FAPDGHAIEVRVYAEDPHNNFLPVTGDILRWQVPDTVRVDAGVQSGDIVSPHYDPMLAKIIAHGHDRATAIRKLDYALAKLQFMGMKNNVHFLRQVLTHPEHVKGNISTQFLDDYSELMTAKPQLSPSAVIAVALAQGTGTSHWRNNPNRPIRHRFTHGDDSHEVLLSPRNGSYLVTIDDEDFEVILKSIKDDVYTLVVNGHQQKFTVVAGKNDQWWVQSLDGTFRLDWQTPLPLPKTTVAEK